MRREEQANHLRGKYCKVYNCILFTMYKLINNHRRKYIDANVGDEEKDDDCDG